MYTTASEESPVVARRRVRLALRDAREARHLTQHEVADAMEWSKSKVMRIETGEVTITPNDLKPLLEYLGIKDGAQVAALIQNTKAARARNQWWDTSEYKEHLSAASLQLVQYELEAVALSCYVAPVIPGPFQTEAYATAVLARWRGELDDAYLDTQLEYRMRRRKQLFTRTTFPLVRLLLDESALYRVIGDFEVLAGQLAELIRVTKDHSVQLRVIPFSVDVPITNAASYDIFYLDDAEEPDAVVYREMYKSDEIVEEHAEVLRHVHGFEHAWNAALGEAQSIEMLRQHASAPSRRPS